MRTSIVIPTYNRCQKLCLLLKSLLQQDFPSTQYEIIVVDDGSTDQTKAAVAEFHSPQIKYFFQKNQGPSAARNRGIANAKGEIILFSDDDMIAPAYWVSRFVKAFDTNPSFAVIQAGCHYSECNSIFGEVTSYFSSMADQVRILPSSRFSEGFEANYIGTGNLAVSKQRLKSFELKFDEALITREDEDFFRRLQLENIAIGFINNQLAHKASLGIYATVKRYFYYGRGATVLNQKWGKYRRPFKPFKYDRSFKSAHKALGFRKAVVAMAILHMRSYAGQLGSKFEAHKRNVK